jgi:hypothetical protein
MTGGTPNHGTGTGTGNNMTLTDAVNELRRLQAKVTSLDQEKADRGNEDDEDEINDYQPPSTSLMGCKGPRKFQTTPSSNI